MGVVQANAEPFGVLFRENVISAAGNLFQKSQHVGTSCPVLPRRLKANRIVRASTLDA